MHSSFEILNFPQTDYECERGLGWPHGLERPCLSGPEIPATTFLFRNIPEKKRSKTETKSTPRWEGCRARSFASSWTSCKTLVLISVRRYVPGKIQSSQPTLKSDLGGGPGVGDQYSRNISDARTAIGASTRTARESSGSEMPLARGQAMVTESTPRRETLQ